MIRVGTELCRYFVQFSIYSFINFRCISIKHREALHKKGESITVIHFLFPSGLIFYNCLPMIRQIRENVNLLTKLAKKKFFFFNDKQNWLNMIFGVLLKKNYTILDIKMFLVLTIEMMNLLNKPTEKTKWILQNTICNKNWLIFYIIPIWNTMYVHCMRHPNKSNFKFE